MKVTLTRFNANNARGWWWYIIVKFKHHRAVWLTEPYKTKPLAKKAAAKL